MEGGRKTTVKNDDGSFQPRSGGGGGGGGGGGWWGTKQNIFRGSLIKHDVDIQGSTVFASRKAVSMTEGDKGWISICRAT